MQRIITDQEIDKLLKEQKPLPQNWATRLAPKAHMNQKSMSGSLEITGADGHIFRVIVRQNPHSLLDFSVILGLLDGEDLYHLIRCNGKHPSEHTNRWEHKRRQPATPIRNQCHIHRATERYQMDGLPIEGFAEVTTEYGSTDTALVFLIDSFGFVRPEADRQQSLFKQ